MHKVKIEGYEGDRAQVLIDGKPIRCRKVDVHMETGYVHTADIELVGEPDMEFDGYVTYDFTVKTVESAVNVLKAALQKNDLVAFLGMNELNRVAGK